MRKQLLLTIALACAVISAQCRERGVSTQSHTPRKGGEQRQGHAAAGKAHTPKPGGAEQQSVLKALHVSGATTYKVNYMKVHGAWAWADVTPLDAAGKPVAEGGPELLHLKAGKWSALDLSKVPEDPQDPLAAQDASATFVRRLRRTFPGVPADIFPRPSH